MPVRLETTRLRPRRRQAAISVEAAARIATAMLIARSAESGIGTGSAKSAATLIIVLIVAGVVWHGVTIGTFERIWDGLVDDRMHR